MYCIIIFIYDNSIKKWLMILLLCDNNYDLMYNIPFSLIEFYWLKWKSKILYIKKKIVHINASLCDPNLYIYSLYLLLLLLFFFCFVYYIYDIYK